ncbi:Uncharacterized protein HZ326_0130 [Fusarium oxysporum f. sp. albedinis]|nr:Uncharacterized protein HZ326_0130 [Fusarium oxysporum f. sp. albedinis]
MKHQEAIKVRRQKKIRAHWQLAISISQLSFHDFPFPKLTFGGRIPPLRLGNPCRKSIILISCKLAFTLKLSSTSGSLRKPSRFPVCNTASCRNICRESQPFQECAVLEGV